MQAESLTTPIAADPSVSVVTALYHRTKALHTQAERTGIVHDILRGDASRNGYICLLRNLHPAYQALEEGLRSHRAAGKLEAISQFDFDRAAAIAADLDHLSGPDWRYTPLLSEAVAYADRIAHAAQGDGSRLIAHAYARYLGDMSGGAIMSRLLARTLQLKPNELTFYDFAPHAGAVDLKHTYRAALDRAALASADPDAIVAEGIVAFEMNIGLSCAVKTRVDGAATSTRPPA